MNKIILVAENPVKWKTLVRMKDDEPEISKRDYAVPFFVGKGRKNEDFSEGECRAIAAIEPRPGDVLVRQEHKDGEAVYSRVNDKDALEAFFDGEYECERRLVRYFLTLLGGRNVDVVDTSEKTTQEQSKKSREGGVKAGNVIGEGSVNFSTSSEDGLNTKMATGRKTSIERTDADFEKAHQMLQRYPWMKRDFSTLLEGVEEGRYHGHYEDEFHQEASREVSTNYRRGLEVAGKYELVSMKMKGSLEDQLRIFETKKVTWKFSMELP